MKYNSVYAYLQFIKMCNIVLYLGNIDHIFIIELAKEFFIRIILAILFKKTGIKI
jgi:hypothetical protein